MARGRSHARGHAKLGFGFDSWIEVAAATVVLIRLRAEIRGGEVDEVKERRALRFVAITFFVLARLVLVEGVRDLIEGSTPNTSIVGIALTGVSIVIMPWLRVVLLIAPQWIHRPCRRRLCAGSPTV